MRESIEASGYPMRTDLPRGFDVDVLIIADCVDSPQFNRADKLGHANSGSGHDSFLKGIIVQYDLTAPLYFWKQWQRYHFHDIISSQSTMHRLLDMDIKAHCNKYVNAKTMDIFMSYIEVYKKKKKEYNASQHMLTDEWNKRDKEELYELYMKIISNMPAGFEITARVTSNYLQLKSIFYQRKNHKLKEDWGYFCNWIKKLNRFSELCLEYNEVFPQEEKTNVYPLKNFIKFPNEINDDGDDVA
jgi:hypothetical protein